MRNVSKYFLLFFLMLLVSCTSLQYQKVNIYPEVSQDKALVYFFRESKYTGKAIYYYIYEGEQKIGALANGTYFFKEFPSGTYTFWAEGEAKDSVTLDLESGKTYYIRGSVDMGLFTVLPDLTVVHELEGKSEIKDLKYVIIKED